MALWRVTMHTEELLDDPYCFPFDYDPADGCVGLLRIEPELLASASFLDERLPIDRSACTWLRWTEIPELDCSTALIFHTAFCGSTLLARALHQAPLAVSLREPRALLSIAKADLLAPADAAPQTRAVLRRTLGLLGRPWGHGGRVLIKPTNQVNRLLPDLLELTQRPALLLYSSLEAFLLSCCKKLPEAETRIRWMAQFLLPGTLLAERLGIPPKHPFNFVESCVLTWYSQIERYAAALAGPAGPRLRTLDLTQLLAHPTHAVAACADWLQLPEARHELEDRVAATFQRDAKRTDRPFNAEQRQRENEQIKRHYAPLVEAALRWADSTIAPAAILPMQWQPLLPLIR